jgi:hypothetical protein
MTELFFHALTLLFTIPTFTQIAIAMTKSDETSTNSMSEFGDSSASREFFFVSDSSPRPLSEQVALLADCVGLASLLLRFQIKGSRTAGSA